MPRRLRPAGWQSGTAARFARQANRASESAGRAKALSAAGSSDLEHIRPAQSRQPLHIEYLVDASLELEPADDLAAVEINSPYAAFGYITFFHNGQTAEPGRLTHARATDKSHIADQGEAAGKPGQSRHDVASAITGVDLAQIAASRIEYPQTAVVPAWRVRHAQALTDDRAVLHIHEEAAAGLVGAPAGCQCSAPQRGHPARRTVAHGHAVQMTGILFRRPIDKAWRPARYKAVRVIERGETGEPRVDQPETLAAPGQLVYTDIAGDVMAGRYEHGVDRRIRRHFGLIAEGPHRECRTQCKSPGAMGDSHRRGVLLEMRVEVVSVGSNRDESIARVGRDQQGATERIQHRRHAVGVLAGETGRRAWTGVRSWWRHGGVRHARLRNKLRCPCFVIQCRHDEPAIEPVENARATELIRTGGASKDLTHMVAQRPIVRQTVRLLAKLRPGRSPVPVYGFERPCDRIQPAGRQRFREHRYQITQQCALLERCHDPRSIDSLECEQVAACSRCPTHVTVYRVAPRFVHRRKKSGTADSIDHEMDASGRFGIEYAMRTRGVEDPCFTWAHVDCCRSAFEANCVGRHDGHMHTHAALPVVVKIGMRRCLGVAIDAHQPRAPDRTIERCQHRTDLRQRSEPRGWLHGSPGALVVRSTICSDQRYGGIPDESSRMRPPGVLRKRLHFLPKSRGIKMNRQTQELGGQSQRCCSHPADAVCPTLPTYHVFRLHTPEPASRRDSSSMAFRRR